jgi:hypothetical protein
VDVITFPTGERSYTRGSIEAIQLLHYRSFGSDDLGGDRQRRGSSISDDYLDNAEVVIFYEEQDSQATGDVSKMILQCLRKESPIWSFNPD